MQRSLQCIFFPRQDPIYMVFVEPSGEFLSWRLRKIEMISLRGLSEADIYTDVTILCDQIKNGLRNMNMHAKKTVKIPNCTLMYFF